MPKEHKHATLICAILTIIALIAIAAGIYFSKPLIIVIVMLPAVIYELYRTEGIYTKFFSFLCLLIVLAEIYAVATGLTVDISKTAGGILKSIPGLSGSIKAGLIGPVILVILSVFLFRRTAGIYTKWLSVIIVLTSAALFYTIDPGFFAHLFKSETIQENIKKEIGNKIKSKL
jgi:hypothetical protein